MEFSQDLVQFYPNRLTISPRYKQREDIIDKHFRLSQQSKINLSKPKSSVNLSKASKKNIRDSIMSMYVLSKPRTIKTPSSKFIYNYRQSFITLTLPATQFHSDVEIKKCLNHFLTNIRRAFNIENYVWKAELQKNENIHFHLSFDKYVHFQAVRYYWLLSLKPLGYIDKYAAKFSQMSLSQYAKYRNLSIKDAQVAYYNGVRSRWQSPNCVDVTSVRTANDVSNYLSKYFAKSEDSNIDAVRIANFGKVWARSQSLSRLKYRNKIEYQEIKAYINKLVSVGAVKRVVYDFSTVYFINFKKLIGSLLTQFNVMLYGNAKMYLYPFPVP